MTSHRPRCARCSRRSGVSHEEARFLWSSLVCWYVTSTASYTENSLSAGLPEKQPETEQVKVGLNAIYNWNYDSDVDSVRALYANALDRQWIALRDLDWDSGIDREKFSKTFSVAGIPLHGTQWWKHLDPELKWSVARKTSAFMLSNFLHGEQGALMVAGEMVNAVPHMDAKFYAATQTMDEARHVEAFAAYINLLDEVRPIMPSLKPAARPACRSSSLAATISCCRDARLSAILANAWSLTRPDSLASARAALRALAPFTSSSSTAVCN